MHIRRPRPLAEYYLAGPMSGIPQFNIPLFDRAAARLRAQGYNIVSPAELDDPEYRAACLASPAGLHYPSGPTYGDLLARDIRLVIDRVVGIIFLPSWWRSTGARIEAMVGLSTGKCFAEYSQVSERPLPVDFDYVRMQLIRNMP